MVDGHIHRFFPKHGAALKEFDNTWTQFRFMCNWRMGMWRQPIDAICDYFGERIAMYFSFLGFYTKALCVPASMGILCAIVVFSAGNPIGEYAAVAFCVLIMVWATVFLEYWKREQFRNAHRWGTRGLDAREQPLPQFQGVYDETLESLVYDESRSVSRSRQLCISAAVAVIAILVVMGTMAFYTGLTWFMQKNYGAGGVVSGLNSITIIVFNTLYKDLSAYLTTLENPRTETEFQNSLTQKTFLFQFMNSFFALYMVAFAKPFSVAGHDAGTWNGTSYNATGSNQVNEWFGSCRCVRYEPSGCFDADVCDNVDCTNLPWAQCSCMQYDCRADVGMLLLTLFGVQIFIGNAMEIVMPQIVMYVKNRLRNQGEDQSDLDLTGLEVESAMPDYEEYVYAGAFDDYNEVVLQFGFVTLFGADFPLVAFLAWFNNMIEMRSDGYKFVHVYRRPTPKPCENIGSWYSILEVMSFAAVSTNCANIFMVSEFAKSLTWSTRVFGLFAAEHIALMAKISLAAYIPDIPADLQKEIEYEEYLNEKAGLATLLLQAEADFADEIHLFRKHDAELETVASSCNLEFPLVKPESAVEVMTVKNELHSADQVEIMTVKNDLQSKETEQEQLLEQPPESQEPPLSTNGESCAHCSEALLPIEDKFSGEIVVVEGAKLHIECKKPYLEVSAFSST